MIASIILILHLMGVIGVESAIPLLYIGGISLILLELFTGTMGIIAFNGVLSLFIAYALQTTNATLFGYPIDWGLIFGVSFFEFILLVVMVVMIKRINEAKPTVGAESLEGEKATVKAWDGDKGKVFVHGETWNARSDKSLDLEENAEVTIVSIDKLTLTITAE